MVMSPLWPAAAAKPPPKALGDAGAPKGVAGEAGAPNVGAPGDPNPGVAEAPNAGEAPCPKPARSHFEKRNYSGQSLDDGRGLHMGKSESME